MPCSNVLCSVVSVPDSDPLARLSVSSPVLRFGMTVPVMVVRALAIDAVPFFASVVTSSLNPFAVFFPVLIAAVVS